MITITVTSYNGAPLAQPLTAQFDELGGNIGRAENNQLVLPDPERTISRVHAQVVFRNGRYGIVDRGSNPISINGRPLGNGQEAPLQGGDQIQIGGYAMRAEASSGRATAAADPFADFAGLAAGSPSGPARAPAAGFADDPLAGFGMSPSPPPGSKPFGAPAAARAAPPQASFGAPSSASGIPADWDPFAPDPVAKPRADDFARSLGQGGMPADFGLEIGGRSAAPLIADLGGSAGGGADSIDNLFGLGPTSSADPLANSVLGQAAALPNMAANADPMKSLNSLTRANAAAAPDMLSELNAPFTLPTAPTARQSVPPAAAVPKAAPAAVATPSPPAPKGSVLSWDQGAGESRTIIRPKGAGAPPAAMQIPDDMFEGLDPFGVSASPAPATAPPVAARPLQTPAAAPVPAAAPAARPASPGTPVAASDMAVLISALREGLGVTTLPMDRLTPEFMRLLGQLIHESTRGTVDLLVARAALKREIRAEMTMIVARENNPLKFSPSVEVALGHLLNPPARGFMPPDKAMRDAYDDLRAHQFGFLAGMRAALEGVLKRFDPAVLEGKLTQRSVLATLLPASRKAQMWDVFKQLYGQISAEASDDFHELFGKEFLRAYEAHIDQLDKDRR